MCVNEREAGGKVKMQGEEVVKVPGVDHSEQWTVHKEIKDASGGSGWRQASGLT